MKLIHKNTTPNEINSDFVATRKIFGFVGLSWTHPRLRVSLIFRLFPLERPRHKPIDCSNAEEKIPWA